MFGDMMDLMAKLKEAKVKAAETKERLQTILIDEKSSDGLLQVTVTASGRVKNFIIDSILLEDKEQLEDYLTLTLNRALEKTQNVYDAEMAAVAQEGMPDIPVMNLFK